MSSTEESSAATRELSLDQVAGLRKSYGDLLPRHGALLDEVVFILEERIEAAGIKVHAVERRIKEWDSVLAKCKAKQIESLSLLGDLVGTRVVCLFRSDMRRIRHLIEQNFTVLEIDDKLSSEHGPLGYLSIHYSCKIPPHYSGPRYEKTSDIVFEIQVRTLCMHAWAAVSHYLDYKGEWDVPAELKQALSALGGLFYVADNEFETFYAARITSMERANRSKEREVNLDTMSAYLRDRFSDRNQSEAGHVSDLVHHIKVAGYTTIEEVDQDIVSAAKAFEAYEEKHRPMSGRYFAVGAARLSLRLVSPAFRKLMEERMPTAKQTHKNLLKFSHLVESRTSEA